MKCDHGRDAHKTRVDFNDPLNRPSLMWGPPCPSLCLSSGPSSPPNLSVLRCAVRAGGVSADERRLRARRCAERRPRGVTRLPSSSSSPAVLTGRDRDVSGAGSLPRILASSTRALLLAFVSPRLVSFVIACQVSPRRPRGAPKVSLAALCSPVVLLLPLHPFFSSTTLSF